MRKNPHNQGFTLVELLIYVAVLMLLLAAIVPFILDMGSVRAKNFFQTDLYSQMRFVTEKIKYEVRSARSINGTAVFVTDLADVPPNSFVIDKDMVAPPSGSTYPVYFDVSGGIIRMKRSGGAWVPLTSTPVTVTDFVFYNNTSGSSQNVTFVVTMVSNQNSAKSNLKETMTTTTSVSLRSTP
jgi:type II secretory pathway pseudopilin PulG